MAAIIRITVSPSIKLQHQQKTARCTRTVARSSNHDSISLQTTPLLQIRSSSIKIKVFEDESSGIVCYRDDKGEITCEGYDEGPRLQFHHRFPSFTCNQRDADVHVIELLQRRLLQIVDGADKDESNYNTFC